MKLKTLNGCGEVVLEEYTAEECKCIFGERDNFVLKCIRCFGEDYGGCQCTENNDTTYEEIIPERVLVKNGHFCGVLILTEYDFYNGGGQYEAEEVVMLSEGKEKSSARCGFSFSNDDHSRWNYTDYYLVERPEE